MDAPSPSPETLQRAAHGVVHQCMSQVRAEDPQNPPLPLPHRDPPQTPRRRAPRPPESPDNPPSLTPLPSCNKQRQGGYGDDKAAAAVAPAVVAMLASPHPGVRRNGCAALAALAGAHGASPTLKAALLKDLKAPCRAVACLADGAAAKDTPLSTNAAQVCRAPTDPLPRRRRHPRLTPPPYTGAGGARDAVRRGGRRRGGRLFRAC